MKTNGVNLDQHINGWPTDERLARIVIHLEVAESIFNDGFPGMTREFETPEQMFAHAEELRERQRRPATLGQILQRGLQAFQYFTRKKGG